MKKILSSILLGSTTLFASSDSNISSIENNSSSNISIKKNSDIEERIIFYNKVNLLSLKLSKIINLEQGSLDKLVDLKKYRLFTRPVEDEIVLEFINGIRYTLYLHLNLPTGDSFIIIYSRYTKSKPISSIYNLTNKNFLDRESWEKLSEESKQVKLYKKAIYDFLEVLEKVKLKKRKLNEKGIST